MGLVEVQHQVGPLVPDVLKDCPCNLFRVAALRTAGEISVDVPLLPGFPLVMLRTVYVQRSGHIERSRFDLSPVQRKSRLPSRRFVSVGPAHNIDNRPLRLALPHIDRNLQLAVRQQTVGFGWNSTAGKQQEENQSSRRSLRNPKKIVATAPVRHNTAPHLG